MPASFCVARAAARCSTLPSQHPNALDRARPHARPTHDAFAASAANRFAMLEYTRAAVLAQMSRAWAHMPLPVDQVHQSSLYSTLIFDLNHTRTFSFG